MTDLGAMFASPYGPLLIFVLRIVDVSCETMRVIMAVRGRRGIAAFLGFFQALIWIVAVGTAIRHLDSWAHLVAYAGGFAVGTFVGVTIERAVAYGLATVRIISSHGGVEIAEALRERGYGVTEFAGFGREGQVEMVHSVVHRRHLREIMAIVEKWDPGAFVTVEEPTVLRGGSFATRDSIFPSNWRRWMRSKQRV